MKIVFFGTSAFAAQILRSLINSANHTILAVVTRPDRVKGRSLQLSFPPVKAGLVEMQSTIDIHQPEKASTEDFAEILKSYKADLFVVVAYGEIIKKFILDIPRLGCINIHASLLPKFRGAAPIQRCLMAGERETGITIIDMVSQMDAGDMLAKAAIPIPEEMNFGELEEKLCNLSCELIAKVLQDFTDNEVARIPQDHTKATFANKILAEDEEIVWSHSAEEIHNLIRALAPFPGAWCKVLFGKDWKRLKIKKSLVEKHLTGNPGHILQFDKKNLVVACGSSALRILEVQLEGKKVMPVEEFLKGAPSTLKFSE